jgi:hypothetical protein
MVKHPEYGFLHTIMFFGGKTLQAYVKGLHGDHYYVKYACKNGEPMEGCGFSLISRNKVRSLYITRGSDD